MTDQVDKPAETPVEPKPGSPEYDAAMAAKFRASKGEADAEAVARLAGKDPTEAPAGDKPKRPDNVPEKFWDAEKGVVNTEALLKSYGELEKGGVKKDETPPATEKKDGATTDGPPEAEAQKLTEKAGLKWDEVRAKIAANGKLDDTDYTAFAGIGIPKTLVDDYVGLATFRAQAETKAALEYAGGPEEGQKLLDWAGKNLSEKEKADYNKILGGEDWKVGIDALKQRRAGALKTAGEPALKGGAAAGVVGTTGYQDRAEQRADIADPLYNDTGPKGTKFRAEVFEKTKNAVWNRKQG